MKTIYETLEMNIIQNEIKRYCASTLGKDKVDSFDIYDDLEDLQISLEKVNEAMKIMNIQGRIPLGGLSDISLLYISPSRMSLTHKLQSVDFIKSILSCSVIVSSIFCTSGSK